MELKQTKKPDRRRPATKRRIREALAELLEESAFEKITVTALAERADIDRKTFYLHYGSISDLMAEIQGEILEEALQLVVSYDLLSPDLTCWASSATEPSSRKTRPFIIKWSWPTTTTFFIMSCEIP